MSVIDNIKKIWANARNYGAKRALSKIKYIVIHWTGNDGDSDISNGNYFKNKVVKASAHYFVDGDSITQSVPDNYSAWSVGGKKYTDCGKTGGGKFYQKATNANTLNIEMCDPVKNGVVYPSAATIVNTLELTKAKMKEYNIPADHVIRHFDVNGKHCPGCWMDEEVWKKEFWDKLTEPDFKAGTWYKALVDIPVRAGYYGQIGKYEYLSDNMKRACVNRGGKGYIEAGNIINPVEVKQFDDGSVWFMLDPTIACLVVGTDGTWKVDLA